MSFSRLSGLSAASLAKMSAMPGSGDGGRGILNSGGAGGFASLTFAASTSAFLASASLAS